MNDRGKIRSYYRAAQSFSLKVVCRRCLDIIAFPHLERFSRCLTLGAASFCFAFTLSFVIEHCPPNTRPMRSHKNEGCCRRIFFKHLYGPSNLDTIIS